jgi:hypothetical protein
MVLRFESLLIPHVDERVTLERRVSRLLKVA